ncbi:LamG-like jellyroll fold domain-containing protein [Paenibacillus cineris]|uniref:LamG-like jellyroll fold domain-containing protein n=1 Tax=Paenibacillus cineris TaxID=237530 RepID=A0ABQ4LIF7_9BACL|nr:LamG-like jellyroll fold domain-containing protein [Paenibacillus cineris]GIO56304.1 hypothetical protein J21TS7_46220 [Paenibacillus cineris]
MNRRWVSAFLMMMLFVTVPGQVFGTGPDSTAQKGGKTQEQQGQAPVYQNVSVHDPSIVKDGDTYYVFGSHIEAARSKDLQSWTRFTNGYTTPGNVLYGDPAQNLAGSFAWAGQNDSDSKGGFSVWAPDVFWNPEYVNTDDTKGAYMLYYCTSSTYIRSTIGFAVSPKIEGPYQYVDTLVYSGFTEGDAKDKDSVINKKWTNTNIPKLIDGGQLSGASGAWFNADGSFANGTYPNAIDPNLYYDKNGQLWMSYGSWSGGIFVLPVDPKTGKVKYPGKDGKTADGRLVDRYFGTKVAGGYGKSGEGPYVVFDKATGYYYLYMTYGWLGADGGYNMRVFRAKNPDGPYVDAQGQNAVLPGDTDNAPYGNKLMGNYLFARDVGDPGTGIGVGYVSPGHNSVLLDDATGKRFLVFHTRFPQMGEAHEVRVHQMYMNADGWPVVAPYRYAGETLSKVDRQDLIGEYKFINHGKGTTADIQSSVYIRLNKDNTISGDVTGIWKKTGHNEAELVIAGSVYKGVFASGWDPVSERYVMTFTASSREGVAVWGSRLEDKTDQALVQDVYNDLNLGDTAKVVSDLALPAEGTRHTAISWKSSDEAVVSTKGEVHRPAGGAPVQAVLTATITKGGASLTKSFTVTVLPYQDAKLSAYYGLDGSFADSQGRFAAGTVTGDRIDKSGGSITFAEGRQGQAAKFDGASGIRLPDGLISSNAYSVALWIKPEELTTYTTAFFGAKDGDHWVSLVPRGAVANNTMVWSGSTIWYDGATGLTIPTGEWSHLAFSAENGTLTVYVNGVQKFKGANFPDWFTGTKASFSLGVNWWDPPFKGLIDELRVYDGALTPAQAADLAKNPS